MKKQAIYISNLACTALTLCIAFAAPAVLAHDHARHSKENSAAVSAEEHEFGKQGDPRQVTRTIVIDMSDAMRFKPSEIKIRQGETVRFAVRNNGKAMHEMVLGTMDELKAHDELMRKNPEMEHDEPYMTHVKPGGREEMVWRFTKAGEFNYDCLVPGHLEAGMVGKIKVTAE